MAGAQGLRAIALPLPIGLQPVHVLNEDVTKAIIGVGLVRCLGAKAQLPERAAFGIAGALSGRSAW